MGRSVRAFFNVDSPSSFQLGGLLRQRPFQCVSRASFGLPFRSSFASAIGILLQTSVLACRSSAFGPLRLHLFFNFTHRPFMSDGSAAPLFASVVHVRRFVGPYVSIIRWLASEHLYCVMSSDARERSPHVTSSSPDCGISLIVNGFRRASPLPEEAAMQE